MKVSLTYLGAIALSVLMSAPVLAQDDWSGANDCFNAADFECAFNAAMDLAKAGRVVVGNDARTTESMTFFQMAYVERAARVSPVELTDMSKATVSVFSKVPHRFPFVAGFSILAVIESCGEIDCSRVVDLYCRIDGEIPQPTWRALDNVNQLSELGQSYFDRVMQNKPNCMGG